MKIKNYTCKCGHDDFFFSDKGNQKGIYCSYCGKWLKWADKDEQNLVMKPKQECILDKIRAEIMKLDDINPDYPMDRTIHISRNEVLQIIDKYKAESEE